MYFFGTEQLQDQGGQKPRSTEINLVLTLEVLFLLVSFNSAGGSYVDPPSYKNNCLGVWARYIFFCIVVQMAQELLEYATTL